MRGKQFHALRRVAEGCSTYNNGKCLSVRDVPSLVSLPANVWLGEYLQLWLWTCAWHLPLQTIRLTAFFARLFLYVVFLLPGLIFGLVYWAFAGENIISINYKAGFNKIALSASLTFELHET